MDHQESPPKKLLCCKLKEGELYGILCEFYLSKAAIKKKKTKLLFTSCFCDLGQGMNPPCLNFPICKMGPVTVPTC